MSDPARENRAMINRRNFLRLIPLAGWLGLGGSSLASITDKETLREPPDDADWDWWRTLPRTPLAWSKDPMTDSLCQAAAWRREVTILYGGGTQPGSSRRIAPLGVFEVEGYRGVYLHAFCHLRQAERTFRIERIAAVV